eukprot:Hpha_TRINITY_DN14062_c0_g2::TRINITY_DN14062_c0_g2_i1::g.43866::m.43866/K06698/PSME3; proteasome activator subunit 3 (PA28 gamma)
MKALKRKRQANTDATQKLVENRENTLRQEVIEFCRSVPGRKAIYDEELKRVMAAHPREAGPGARAKSMDRAQSTVPPLLRRSSSFMAVDAEAPPAPPSPQPRPADAPPSRKPLPDNSTLRQYLKVAKREAISLHQAFNSIADLIMSLTPEIKDEDNFGVEVQENVLAEIAAMIVATTLIRDMETSYLAKRAEVESQLYKHPWAPTWPRVLRTLDMCQWDALEKSWRDMARITILSYSLLTSNQEKVFEPRREQVAMMIC